jgi:hypothetical protein
MLETVEDAISALLLAWPVIIEESRAAFGGEAHYQAVVYHCLRMAGVPRKQLGMNVKQWITNPVTPDFQARDLRKHESYRGGFEPIPDAVIFAPAIDGDWRRRRREDTLKHMLVTIEMKASERDEGRLGPGEIESDIKKLNAHRTEVQSRGADMHPVMMVIDTAEERAGRMTDSALARCQKTAEDCAVSFMYISPTAILNTLKI